MSDLVLTERANALRETRADLYAFAGAFVAGLGIYLVLRSLAVPQFVITGTIVLVMLAYAFVVARVPRLRVRLDQAGDNAYYLGLLFTLISMAMALHEFGAVTTGDPGETGEKAAVEQIIGSFGVALFSTITGIFLRVVLHQMRVDPADVESMTRIELSEAAKRLRASLDSAAGDIGRFHEEMRQRTSDAVEVLVSETTKAVTALSEGSARTTQTMVESTSSAHMGMLGQVTELTRTLSSVATEAMGAVERLRTVEGPPLTLSRRLDKVTKLLEALGNTAEQLVGRMEGTAAASATNVEHMSKASQALSSLSDDLMKRHAEATERVTSAIVQIGAALSEVGDKLKHERDLLVDLEAESRRTVEESTRVQAAAAEVLMTLTEVTRGLTTMLNRPQ
jgi:hypothetical protein